MNICPLNYRSAGATESYKFHITTLQFFQIIQTEIGDTKKTISDTWFSAMT